MRLEVDDLPLDAEITTAEVEAVPFDRSGMTIAFPLARMEPGDRDSARRRRARRCRWACGCAAPTVGPPPGSRATASPRSRASARTPLPVGADDGRTSLSLARCRPRRAAELLPELGDGDMPLTCAGVGRLLADAVALCRARRGRCAASSCRPSTFGVLDTTQRAAARARSSSTATPPPRSRSPSPRPAPAGGTRGA